MPMVVTLLFGSERLRYDAPDPAVVAEDTIAAMIDHCARLGIDAGDCAAMVALDCIARLSAYNRAPLPVVIAAIAAAAPVREMLLRDANERGVEPPSLGAAKLAIASACRLH
jgi:hypothetical protein